MAQCLSRGRREGGEGFATGFLAFVLPTAIHTNNSIVGVGKREAHMNWSMMNLQREYPLLELP